MPIAELQLPKRLPPLRALEAFVVAGRMLSFKDAAAALRITPSALSRRIQSLEQDLGLALFRRFNRGLALTDPGRQYLEQLAPAFDAIEAATRQVRPGRRAKLLKLSLLQSFASNWLIPRLPDFYARHPDIELEMESTTDYADFARDEVDLAIRFGTGPWPGLLADRLMDIEVYPICNPALLTGRHPLRKPADLAHHTLLIESHTPEIWRDWLALAGVPGLVARQEMQFDNFQLLYQAAANGLGIALSLDQLAQTYRNDPRLVVPFPLRLKIAKTYHLVGRPAERNKPAIKAFRNWIKAAARD